jgi:hypothetical protein
MEETCPFEKTLDSMGYMALYPRRRKFLLDDIIIGTDTIIMKSRIEVTDCNNVSITNTFHAGVPQTEKEYN